MPEDKVGNGNVSSFSPYHKTGSSFYKEIEAEIETLQKVIERKKAMLKYIKENEFIIEKFVSIMREQT